MTQYIIVGLIMLACVFFLEKTRLQQRLRQMRRLRLNRGLGKSKRPSEMVSDGLFVCLNYGSIVVVGFSKIL